MSGGTRLEAGSVIVIEPGAAAEAAAASDDAVLLVFNPTAALPASSCAGGNVHILPADRVPRMVRLNERANVGAAIFADSACPTCELWLHESAFHDGDFNVDLHSHSEDEIIVVTAGEIVLGQRRYGRGTAIAVAKEAVYGFRTGREGLTFINFRPSHPTYRTADGTRVIDEQALYMGSLGRPPYLPVVMAGATV
ncbi:hypothetical protein [Sphingomonas solaris]|uniref:Cupin domain-containing protein n=1 Tax=Alterirhizorhabdus solaris TaxID=2529389 RepID=A0A558R548_9SPHN|nr:hypothetical protein [Sphingomonas solaris]TVV74477.1 hypothetical protein FOY91_09865 [Sphingomonas solaris]